MKVAGQISSDDWNKPEYGIKKLAQDIQDGKISFISDKNKKNIFRRRKPHINRPFPNKN